MSYSPEPNHEEEYRWLFGVKGRFIALYQERPILFWLRCWLVCLAVWLVMSFVDGFTAPTRIGEWMFLTMGVFGWIIPFVLFIRAKRQGDIE